MRWIVFLVGLLVAVPAAAQPKLLQAHASGSPPTYTGPIDVAASPTALYSLRAGSAAIAAAGTQTIVNIRRASDNVACDFLPTIAGNFGVTTSTCNSSTQGGVSYGTFVGTDATASCTIAGTAVACTGASSTLHVNDPITGVGITQPCLVTVTNGSTTATASIPGTSTSCGTVSVAETVTFQVAGFVPKIYDQSGNIKDASQATAGSQPQFLPVVTNGLPGIFMYTGATTHLLTATLSGTVAQAFSISVVSQRIALLSSNDGLFQDGSNAVNYGASNSLLLFAGGGVVSPTASDGAFHALNILFNGASSATLVDGTSTGIATVGTSAWGATIILGEAGHPCNCYFEESALWPTSINRPNMHTNQSAFYGTP